MENLEDESEVAMQVSPDVVYHQDKAAIDVQISTAKAYPRNPKRSMTNALAIATMDEQTAETCTYAVPRGGKKIQGPSVHLAKILAQTWGNLRVEAKVVSIDQTQVTSEAVCFDLETNFAIKTQVKRSIMQNEMKWDDNQKKSIRTGRMIRMSEDMVVVTGNAANSIALRNAVLSVIPRAIVDKVYNAAKQTITGDVSNETKLIARRKQVVEGLRDTYNVTEAEILETIGRASIDHLTPDDLVALIGIGTAIKDGDTTVDQAFRGVKSNTANKEPQITKEELQALYDKKEAFLSKEEMNDAKRIIANNETNSFQKIKDMLNSKSENNG
jgi:hypothetical protein